MPTKAPSELEKLLTFALGASDEQLDNAIDVFRTVKRTRTAGSKPAPAASKPKQASKPKTPTKPVAAKPVEVPGDGTIRAAGTEGE